MKKIISAVLISLMILACVPISVFAEVLSTDVAKIGDVGYATVTDAMYAVEDGETIVILKDTTLEGVAGFILNGSKYTIKGVDSQNKVKLTIKGNSGTFLSLYGAQIVFEDLKIDFVGRSFSTGEDGKTGSDDIGSIAFNNCDITTNANFKLCNGSTVTFDKSTMTSTSNAPTIYLRNNRSSHASVLNIIDSHITYAGAGTYNLNVCTIDVVASSKHTVNIRGNSIIETRGRGAQLNHIAVNRGNGSLKVNMDDSVTLYLNPQNPSDNSGYFFRGQTASQIFHYSGNPLFVVNDKTAAKGFKYYSNANVVKDDAIGTYIGFSVTTENGDNLLVSGKNKNIAAGLISGESTARPVYISQRDFEMHGGASLRTVVGESGIRFSTTYTKALENIIDGRAVFGTLISPTKLLGSNELTLENADILNATMADSVLNIVSTKQKDGTYHAAIIMPNEGVDEKSIYSLELAARGYMTVTYDDGRSATFYTAFDDENIRSMHKVSENLYLKHIDPNDSYTMSDGVLANVNNIIDKVGLPLPEPKKTLSVLAIGNSFSIDAMEYLWQICNDAGYDTVELGNLFIGGCSLNTHWSNILNNKASYTYYQNTDGTWTSTTSSANDAIKSKKWDIITVQQSSDSSGVASSYGKLNNILNYIEANTPSKTKVLWHMTWAYQGNSTHAAFPTYGSNQTTMYNAIVDAVGSEILTNDRIDGVIPSGTAIQNLRTSYFGDTLTRDGYHLSYDYGRYTAALTWFAYITGEDISDIDWVPSGYPNIAFNLSAIKEAVTAALDTPFEVTQSTNTTKPTAASDAELFATNGLNISGYTELSLNMTTNRFYNSTKSHGLEPASDKNSPNFSATQIFSIEDLPVGTVIIVDSGYQYRPDGWKDASTLNSSSMRPGNISKNFTVIDDTWWGDFTLRGFNLGKTSGTAMTEADNVHLRIYVPVN